MSTMTTPDVTIARVVTCSLPKAEWTHEAHLAATTYLTLRRPDINLDAELPGIIRSYNESVGGVNDDTQGYHDTITRAYLRGVRLFLEEADTSRPIHELVNELLHSPMGKRDWPLSGIMRASCIISLKITTYPDVWTMRWLLL